MPGVVELWRSAIALVLRHWKLFAGLGIAGLVVPGVLLRLIFSDFYSGENLSDPTKSPDYPPGLLFATLLLFLLQMLIYNIVVALAASRDEAAGEPLGALAGRGLKGLGKSLVAGVLVYLASMVLFIGGFVVTLLLAVLLMMISGIKPSEGGPADPVVVAFTGLIFVATGASLAWLALRMAALAGVYVEEEPGVIDGLKRSWALSRGHGWWILRGYLVQLPVLLLLVALQLPLMFGKGGAGAQILAMAVLPLSTAFWLVLASWMGLIYRRLADAETEARRSSVWTAV